MVSIGSPTHSDTDSDKGFTMRKLVALIITAAAVAGFFAAPANAAETTTTFALSGGALSITAPSSAQLGSVAAGTAAISATLGSVSVNDARGNLVAAWTTSASSTDFVTGTAPNTTTITKTNVLYTPPTVPTSNAATVVAAGIPATLSTLSTVVTAAGVGNSTITWTPTIAITLPVTGAVAGTYTGTITHSIA